MNVRSKQNVSSLIMIIMVVVFNSSTVARVSAGSKISNSNADFAGLQLKVIGIRLEDKIEEKDFLTGKTRATWCANKPDNNLIVVTLQGIVPSKGYYTFMPDSFALFYDYEKSKGRRSYNGSEREVICGIKHCRAIRIVDTTGNWSIRPPDHSVTITQLLSPGPFTMEVAAIIPAEAASCSVIIPTLAVGKAITSR
jgi:hypothetical protein